MNFGLNETINKYLASNGLYLDGYDFRKLDDHEIVATVISYDYSSESRKLSVVVKPVVGLTHIDVNIEWKNEDL